METIRFSCIESRIETNRSFYGRFQLGPFFSGQGLTVANALRRTLLSELSGLAILYVEIEGAAHEYSTLPGMKESVLDLLLSLKQLVFTSNFSVKEPQIGYLYFQGPGVVRASDLKLPSFLQIVDPDQYIATLSYDAVLKIRCIICQGKSYYIHNKSENFDFASIKSKIQIFEISEYLQSFDQTTILQNNLENTNEIDIRNYQSESSTDMVSLQTPETHSLANREFTIEEYISHFQKNLIPIRVLPIDAVFMPVTKVNFVLENNDDSETFKERVILEIWTNGSIHPKQALHEASTYLVTLFSSFQQKNILALQLQLPHSTIETKQNVERFESQKHSSSVSQTLLDIADKKLTALDIGNLELSLRPYTCLKRANIHTVGDLLEYSPEELLLLKNFGKRSLEEVENNLSQLGLRLHAQKNDELIITNVNPEIE